VGDVSANEDYYKVFQPADIVDYEAQALEQYSDTVRPKGHVRESDDGHKLKIYTNLDGIEAEPLDGDVYELGKRTSHAHTGMHGLHHEPGMVRVYCTNGNIGFDSEKSFSQTHNDPLNYALFEHAYDSIIHGVEDVEERLQAAADQELINREEALLILADQGIDTYLPGDDPIATLWDALDEELADDWEHPTLYETYNAATRAITHADGIAPEQRDQGLKQASNLLDWYGEVPDSTTLGKRAVEQRVETHTTEEAVEPYWDDEEETLQTLVEAHGDAAEGGSRST